MIAKGLIDAKLFWIHEILGIYLCFLINSLFSHIGRKKNVYTKSGGLDDWYFKKIYYFLKLKQTKI